MAARKTPDPTPQRPRIFLIAHPDSAAALSEAMDLRAAMPDLAAVLLRLPPNASERTFSAALEAASRPVQGAGAALLVDGHAPLVAGSLADGAHLFGLSAFQAAVPLLKPDRIAGVGGLATRHDAMVAGEAGADYVMFGEPDPQGHKPSFQAVLDRVTWWAEIFEPPCIGYASDLDEVTALGRAGADFVALDGLVWNHAGGPAEGLKAAGERLHALELA
jgi:thiamine-phosphate pyrophosphorylase